MGVYSGTDISSHQQRFISRGATSAYPKGKFHRTHKTWKDLAPRSCFDFFVLISQLLTLWIFTFYCVPILICIDMNLQRCA